MSPAFTSLLFAAMLATAIDRTLAQADAAKPDTADYPPDSTFAELEGAWIPEKILSAGHTVPKEKFPFELCFKPPNRLIRKGITVGKVTGRDSEHEITLDGSKRPAIMNMTRTVRGEPQTVFAIYKIEGDVLTICFLRGTGGRPSSERPTVFGSDKVTKSDLLVLKRRAKAKQ